MPDHFRATPEEIKGFGGLLERNANHFKTIEKYAHETASDTSGFTGLLAALIPAAEGVTSLYCESLKFAHTALMKVKDEIGHVAREYDEREQRLIAELRKIESDLDKVRL